ncbi:FAD-dependent oxidoreductase [Deinococcus sp. UYEF24]
MTRTVETDVLIVGNGPAGGAAALALSTYGIANISVTRYRWLANSPRAHITNQGTMEVLRDLGVEQEAISVASPQHLMGTNTFCLSLAGEELGRLNSWGTHPARKADYDQASPTQISDIPQTFMEPILVSNAAKRGSQTLFSTDYLGLTQDDSGVTARVRDRLSGEEYTIRAKYLLGADGGNSLVAQEIGLPMEGQMAVAGSMNILFEADLSRYVAHRPSVLYWVLQPGCNIGGIGMGLVRMVRPWNEWLIVWGYDIAQPAPVYDDAAATDLVRSLVGDPALDVKIKSTSLWTNNKMYAREYSRGRVFCMGDAVHRHPPSNGLGSNTSIQDGYNLAWKLALVLRGQAGPGLLDSYDAERAPIGKQIVERANKSIEEYGPIFGALGLLDTQDADEMNANMQARKENTPEAKAQRQALRDALDFKTYEFNAHGVELGMRYRSGAVVRDGTPEPVNPRDPELYYQPTTWPGARLPHAWVQQGHTQVSTRDLCGQGRFTLLTGISGGAWAEAARSVSARLGIEIMPVVMGPGQATEDLWGDWTRLREIDESGALLVRPDIFIGARFGQLSADPAGELEAAMRQILNLDTLRTRPENVAAGQPIGA